ncbi:PQQ-dependent sugar dehydrogenase [Paenibacillus sp. GCM10023248]|uniref:PQQ-dependent sugar dehydrogenase n=1 Tax=unclassified Paenibacillus TaxID=185978 RepID=UPI0023787AC8|nr:PQQ-dependent sugar dehydrogenase [Paenibacillus sp. MAHUQ-63]MDD9268094.1 PQQ-dependent sugar dehydrogenase [Paenibacillus sp. MAHUQ-63]
MKAGRLGTILMAAAIMCSACTRSSDSENQVKTADSKPAAARAYTVLAEHLKIPWSIQFDGDTIYVSEREGHIVQISGDSVTRQKVQLKKPVKHQGEGGFLGLQLSPDFAKTKQAYAYHTYEEGGKAYNRVIMLQKKNGGWEEVKAYLEGIPGAYTHNGGRIAIGPDQMLYVTTGDSGNDMLAQDMKSTAGKILRMTLDGKVPADNPFPGSYVYTYGHRNPQGIVWDKQGRMYNTEHGPSGDPGGHDEVNLIEKGKNYGWPLIIGSAKKESMVSPLYHTGNTAIAPSGMTVDADGQLLFATLRGQKLYKYNPAANQLTTKLEGEGRLRDVKLHNGDVYVITNNTDGRGSPGASDDRLLLLKP